MNEFEFAAIFGSSTEVKKTVIRPEPTLPWDDPLWSYSLPSKASADVCAKIESDAFLKGILGEMPKHVAPEPELFAIPQASDTKVTRIVRLADGTTLTNPTYDRHSRCWWQDGVKFAGDLVSIEVK
jgi:hypothetical protein